MLALARIGFSVDDVRRMTMAEAIAYTDLAFGGSDGGAEGVRDATQEDIDRLLS